MPRGLRLVHFFGGGQVMRACVAALAMAVERAEFRPEPVELLGSL
jgi:hypothetical protein